MTGKNIQAIIEHIMIKDGPDGHTDGSEIITSFVSALLKGKGDEWYKKYIKPKK